MEHKVQFMVVDDDATSNLLCRYAIRRFFENAIVAEFTNPEAALDSIRSRSCPQIDTILFLDINMPAISGWDFLDIFRGFDRRITASFTIYILSSSVEAKDMEKADNDPLVSGFLVKPLSKEALAGIAMKIS